MRQKGDQQSAQIPNESKNLLGCSRIHEPCFPYFGSVYIALLSVMQGIVLAATLSPFAYFVYRGSYEAILFIPILIQAVVIWHKYVNHHQVLGWQLGPLDTVLVATFGLLQAFMVSAATQNYPVAGNSLLLNIHIFDSQIICILFEISISGLLGVAAYAYSGATASDSYVKNALAAHFNSCPKYEQRKIHCMLSPEELYSFLIGFEVWCIVGTLEISILLFLNLSFYLFLTIFLGVSVIPSSVISITISAIILFYYAWRYDFKRAVSDFERILHIISFGDESLLLTETGKNKFLCWMVFIPVHFLDSLPLVRWLDERI
ncbi:MAG: hypothetical protein ACL93V_03350 [Candidatus Electrothrix sp. YB6]